MGDRMLRLLVGACRCHSRGGMLACYDADIATDYHHDRLCPLPAAHVADKCVWFGLLKPWLTWPRTRTCLSQLLQHW